MKKLEIHPEFKIVGSMWSHNRHYDPMAGSINCKIQVFFDDVALLDSCPFMAKVGLNTNPEIKARYIAFCYGNGKTVEELKQYALRFPQAFIIYGLDHDGCMHEGSVVYKLLPEPKYSERELLVY